MDEQGALKLRKGSEALGVKEFGSRRSKKNVRGRHTVER